MQRDNDVSSKESFGVIYIMSRTNAFLAPCPNHHRVASQLIQISGVHIYIYMLPPPPPWIHQFVGGKACLCEDLNCVMFDGCQGSSGPLADRPAPSNFKVHLG